MKPERKLLILGAGPAGLTLANRLLQRGEASFLVLEAESEAGGLCRSAEVDSAPFVIGGGHFLDTRRPEVNRFLFGFLPEEEWNRYERRTTLHVRGQTIGQPIEAYLWQLDIESQIEYLKSIAAAGCNIGAPEPECFLDWIVWKLGTRIAEDYMIPYNTKMFGRDLDALGTYWLAKLPNVSFEETLRSCLERKRYGTDPGHSAFYYPKRYGYGELWLRMAERLGDRIQYGKRVACLDFLQRRVRTADGFEYGAERIVTTIPWTAFEPVGMPEELREDVRRLKHTSVWTEYCPETLDTDSHWVYEPDLSLSYHRILVRHNFCPGSRGYWTETNAERYAAEPGGSEALAGSGRRERARGTAAFRSEYAYPLNTLDKPDAMKRILDWSCERGVYGLGRWGEWEHYNSDVTAERAMRMAEELA